MVAALREAADYTYSLTVSGLAGFAALLFAIGYDVLAFERVYRERWLATVSKTM